MTLAPGHHVIPLRIDLAAARIGQNRHQALAGHGRRDVDATCLAERGSEVHQVHEVRDDASRQDPSGPAHGEGDFATDVVQVALGARHAGDAVVAADHQQGVVEFAGRPQFLDDDSQALVHGLAFAQVVRGILPDVVHIGEERRQPSLQIIRLDPPQRLA